MSTEFFPLPEDSYEVLVDDIPDFVTAKELDYHFEFVSGSSVRVKMVQPEEGFAAAWVTVTSYQALLKVMNTVPLPILWPDIQLR